MKNGIYILIFALLFALPSMAQKGKAKKWKQEAKDDVTMLSSKDYPYIDKFHDAVREKLSGNLAEAKKLFEECLKENKNDDAVYYALATIAKADKNTSLVLEMIEKAYEIDPENITYLQELAYANYEKANFDKAEDYFKEMVERQGRNVDFRYGYCNVLIYNKNYKEAITQLDKLQEQTGTVPELVMMKADLYTELKEDEKAESTLLQLKEEFPKDMDVLKNIIGYYEQRNEREKAISMIEELVENNPDNGKALFILANNYLAMNQQDNFIAIADRVIQNEEVTPENKLFIFDHLKTLIDPKDERLFKVAKSLYDQSPENEDIALNYGSILVLHHRTKEATTIFREILKNTPDNYEVWARVLMYESDFKEFEALYEDGEKAVELFPTLPFLYYLAAEGALETGHPEEASDFISAGEIYIIDDPIELARYSMRKGEIDFYNKEYKKGIVAFENALSIKSDPIILITYSKALCKANIAMDVAEEMLKSVEEKDQTMNFFYAEGMYYMQLNQYKKGIKSVSKGIDKVFNNAELHDLLGDLYIKSENAKKAVESWKTAEKLESRNKNISKKIKEEKFYAPSYL